MGDVAKTQLDESKNKEEKEERAEIPLDEPITKEKEDLLDRKPFVENVVNVIKTNIKPPYSIGIYGDWGSGKTSIMRLIEEKIKDTDEYRTIWFNAWEYENEANLVYPLVYLIKKDIPRTKFKKVISKIPKMLYTISKAALEMTARVGTAGLIDVQELEKYERDYLKEYAKVFDNWIDEVGKIKEGFRELTEVACKRRKGEKRKKKCIMIFIDDLDRCLPENSIKILESIKSIFSQGNCIFVLGVDKKTVARVIKGRYPTLTDIECEDYLAKIVPFGLDVPEIGVLYFEGYFKSMYDKLKIDSKAFAVDLGDVSKICVSSRLHNPRKIKRALIAFYLYSKIKQSRRFYNGLESDIGKENITHQDVLMFCLFREFWSGLFERVLIANYELAELTGVALNRGFRDWTTEFSNERTHPVIKNFAADHNLYRFLRDWQKPQTDNFVNTLVRIARLIELK